MYTWFVSVFNIKTLPFLLTFFCLLSSSPSIASTDKLKQEIGALENQFKRFSTQYYQQTRHFNEKSRKKIPGIDKLVSSVDTILDINPVYAVELMHFNKETILDNLDDKAVFRFTEILLEQNDWSFANEIYQGVRDIGDKSLLATVQFIFAKYHANRHEWGKVNQLLEGNFSELQKEDAAYAYLLNGSALQHLKLHRRAASNYEKIPPGSKYYSFAQLNAAIANIRQGWWTDAQSTIRTLIKTSQKDNRDEFTNRLYLVLGYALLQKEYYRDARDAFRQIGLDNRYTNRALLGIGLTATSQGDYIGGINALSILKEKKTYDLSVDESYLLVPYVYEKLQQEITVTASYSEAMNYYQVRIQSLRNIQNRNIDFEKSNYDDKTQALVFQNNSFDYGKTFPVSFINNYRQLLLYKDTIKRQRLLAKVDALIKKYDSIYQRIVDSLIKTRTEYLGSYLNQSRYGLARLYDRSSGAPE